MPPLDDVLEAVDTWFAEEVQRPPVSYHTECYNQMYAARANLKNRLSVALTGKPLETPAPLSEELGAGAEGADQAEEPETASDEASASSGAGRGSTKPKAE